MSICLTKEKEFVVLLSITDLDGGATKKQVLDNIQRQNYLSFSAEDLAMKTNRKEVRWRNDLAYTRRALVTSGYVNNDKYDQWSITDAGKNYLYSLCQEVANCLISDFKKLSPNTKKRAIDLVKNITNGDLEKISIDVYEDQMVLKNETQEIIIERIKRYKKIVDELKNKYGGCCQVENCRYTFQKSNGENYAEGHHLIPLARGGDQSADNVIVLCANHHRMLHYAKVEIKPMMPQFNKRPIIINGDEIYIIYLD